MIFQWKQGKVSDVFYAAEFWNLFAMFNYNESVALEVDVHCLESQITSDFVRGILCLLNDGSADKAICTDAFFVYDHVASPEDLSLDIEIKFEESLSSTSVGIKAIKVKSLTLETIV